MNCEEFEELSGAYVLDAVTPEEREEARAHLAGCVKCTRLLEELRATVGLLPLSVTQVSPPPSLKERVLAAIRQEQAASMQGRGQRPQQVPGSRRTTWRGRRVALAAAAVFLLALLGGMTAWNLSLQHALASQQQSTASLQRQNSALQREVNALEPQIAISYTILGIGHSTQGATGKLIYLPQQHLTVLVMQGLPGLKGTQVYQGWLMRGNTPLSIGLLSVQNGIASVDFPGDVRGFNQAAVSVERGPGASKNSPSGPLVAAGALKGPMIQRF